MSESNSHTLINELKNNSSITDPEQIRKYKHIVTRSIQGDVDKSKAEFFKIENINADDTFIICSDGVHDIFGGLQIQQILNSSDTMEEAFNRIEKRLLDEAKDNFSLIVSTR